MKLTFLGGAQTVTGSCFLLESGQSKLLVDCGMYQGKAVDRNYQGFNFDPSQLDYVLVTHTHLDHIGRIPQLVKNGFEGKILSTAPTKELASIVLNDSYHIMTREVESEALFQQEHIEQALDQWESVEFDNKVKLDQQFEFTFRTAGHILGSAITEIWADDKKIVFSGDLGNSPGPLLKAPHAIKKADYVVIESAYGDRIHENQEQRKHLLEDAIENTISSGGTLMVPAFAIERTQKLLYELNSLVENKRIPRVPIFIDSPMAIKALSVYKKYEHLYDKQATELIEQGDDLFDFPGLELTKDQGESKKINQVDPPKIIIAGAGMSTGGRILHHEIRYLPDPNSCLLLICYQVEGTLGRKISDGADQVEIFGEQVPVNAEVKTIDGYSDHADQEQLMDWIDQIEEKPEQVFVTQGEQQSSEALSQEIKDHLGLPAVVPSPKQEFEL